MYEITAERFRSSLEGYKFIEVEKKTILEIYRFWKVYLKKQGIENPKLIGDVNEDSIRNKQGNRKRRDNDWDWRD